MRTHDWHAGNSGGTFERDRMQRGRVVWLQGCRQKRFQLGALLHVSAAMVVQVEGGSVQRSQG
jgi:hypothetical protein